MKGVKIVGVTPQCCRSTPLVRDASHNIAACCGFLLIIKGFATVSVCILGGANDKFSPRQNRS